MGFEQSYVSALELGIKGPPSRDFVDRLVRYLRLSADEFAGLLSELEASRVTTPFPQTATSDAYRLCGELWRELDLLSDARIRVMRELIETWRRDTVIFATLASSAWHRP
jgi:transcriptional regulator with XRE-family HTH domain